VIVGIGGGTLDLISAIAASSFASLSMSKSEPLAKRAVKSSWAHINRA
jgi:hypothetical protein